MAKPPKILGKRKQNIINVNAKILIICEGLTEANYFRQTLSIINFPGLKIESISAEGSAPISIVRHAENKQSSEISKYGEHARYDNIFCIYDNDEHQSLTIADEFIQKYNRTNQVFLTKVFSNPCFEFWLLLHFKASTRPFHKTGAHTASKNCISELKLHLPGYDKNTNLDTYITLLSSKLDNALKNARQIYKNVISTNSYNPSTQIHLLFDYLYKIKASLKAECNELYTNPELNFN